MARIGKGVRSYDTQTKEKTRDREEIKRQFNQHGYEIFHNEPLMASMLFGIPYPKNTSKKKKAMSPWVLKKPDIDNYVKYILDCMNEIVFSDDNLVASIHAYKIYTDHPFSWVSINPLGGPTGGMMVNEHAMTIQGEITVEALDYIVKKSNKLGKSGRAILRVYAQEDAEGKHIYFETEPL